VKVWKFGIMWNKEGNIHGERDIEIWVKLRGRESMHVCCVIAQMQEKVIM
jgi:hypothetical protein